MRLCPVCDQRESGPSDHGCLVRGGASGKPMASIWRGRRLMALHAREVVVAFALNTADMPF